MQTRLCGTRDVVAIVVRVEMRFDEGYVGWPGLVPERRTARKDCGLPNKRKPSAQELDDDSSRCEHDDAHREQQPWAAAAAKIARGALPNRLWRIGCGHDRFGR